MNENHFQAIDRLGRRSKLFNREKFIDKQIAYKRLKKQIKDGERPKVSEFICSDCKINRAEHYHHESYKIPECDNVIPLCVSCHKFRHITIIKIDGFEDDILSYIKKHKDGVGIAHIAKNAVCFEFDGKDKLKNWNYKRLLPVVRSYLRVLSRSGRIVIIKEGLRNYFYKIASSV